MFGSRVISCPYTSCIRINNVPILPPLITAEKLRDIKRYKKEAIIVEERIKKEKMLKSICIQSRIETESNTMTTDCIETESNQCNIDDRSSTPKLSCNIQVSQYINNEFLDISTECNLSRSRSNSYTLGNPSPALIDFMKKQQKNELEMSDAEYRPQTENSIVNIVITEASLELVDEGCRYTTGTESELRNFSDWESSPDVETKLKYLIENNIPNTITTNAATEANCVKTKLMEVLNNIPVEYSVQIIDLLERQWVESKKQSRISEDNSSVTTNHFDGLQHNPEKFSTPNESTMKYVLDKPSNKLSEIDNQLCRPCSKEDAAATIITAAVKGFLTRRLLKTTRVQDLKKVVRDAVFYAMEMHKEDLDQISESDVELYQRLIQQVTTACRAFHEVFFDTTVEERMAIIAADRQLKLEKLKRPTSRSSSSSRSKYSARK